MKLHELKPSEGSRQVRNRVGRGKQLDADKKVKKLVQVAEYV